MTVSKKSAIEKRINRLEKEIIDLVEDDNRPSLKDIQKRSAIALKGLKELNSLKINYGK
jgi:hypothetical protein